MQSGWSKGTQRAAATLVLGVVLLGTAAFAAEVKKQAPATVKPVPRLDNKSWAARHEAFLARAKKGEVDVLFLGDSITQGWEGAGKAVWKERFEPLKAANFGIGGDRTEHVLWRITEGKELEGINPKLAVLMIGTNNVASNSAAEIAEGITAIVKTLRQARPQMKILLLGVFPRSGKPGKSLKDQSKVAADELQPKIKEINERIAKLDDGKHVQYLDIGSRFLNEKGELTKEVMPDFLHLSPKGYQIWADAIKEPLEKLLKTQ